MRSNTQTVTIAADPVDVFDFVRQAENLPRWAIGFAQEVSHGAGGWTVVTGQGPVGLVIEVDDVARTVDFCMHPAPGVEAKAFARILSNGDQAEFVFTQLQQPGTSDEVFEQLIAAVGHELVTLKALLEVQCPL